MTEQLLVRADEAARMLGVCRSKAYAMLASGELPAVRIGRSVRVPVAALRAWVEKQTSAAADGTDVDAVWSRPDLVDGYAVAAGSAACS